MYGFDIGMHVGENLKAIEKKEKAQAKEAKAKARQERAVAQANAQAQVQTQAHVQAQAQAQVQSEPPQVTQSAPISPRLPSHEKLQKQKPGPLMMPFNVFQDQMRKGSPANSLQPPQQRPGGPNRAISFPAFPPGFGKGSGPNSGLNSLANSAYNSPLPSPGLSGPAKKAFFPFGPKTDGDDSNTSVSRPSKGFSVGLQLTITKSPK